jgi:hypothetical protein
MYDAGYRERRIMGENWNKKCKRKKAAVVGKERVGAQRRMISDNDAIDAVRSKEGKKQ